jgi:hypothetical protein
MRASAAKVRNVRTYEAMPVNEWCDDRTRCVPSTGSATGDASPLLQRLVEGEWLGTEVTRHWTGRRIRRGSSR